MKTTGPARQGIDPMTADDVFALIDADMTRQGIYDPPYAGGMTDREERLRDRDPGEL